MVVQEETEKKNSFKENLIITYFILGTIVLSMTAYITFMQLKKMNHAK